jgi:hypothetical protein
MRTLLSLLAGLFVAWNAPARAQDTAVTAIIQKAIKAHGGEEALNKYKAGTSRSKGRLEVGTGLDFTQEMTYQLPNQFKEVLEIDVDGKKIPAVTVFNGEKGWVVVNGQFQDIDDKLLTELKEAGNLMRASRLTTLLQDRAFKLSSVGEAKVNGRAALGVRVESKGFRDVNLYFDKDTGLLLKTERRALDVASGQEVNEERVVVEYQKLEGMQSPKKVVVNRDGKKFMEAEVLEVKLLEKVDPQSFAKPGQ